VQLSLTLEGFPNRDCSRCNAKDVITLSFTAITDEHTGEAAELCLHCACQGGSVDIPLVPLAEKPSKRKAFRKIKKVSLKQEVEVNELLGARTQPGSGNQRGAKGDGRRVGDIRTEQKFTVAESFSLKLDELWKIAGEATRGEMPVFVIDYRFPGTSKLRDRFVVLPFNDVVELLGLRREKNATHKHR
jgi:hypothetical protein